MTSPGPFRAVGSAAARISRGRPFTSPAAPATMWWATRWWSTGAWRWPRRRTFDSGEKANPARGPFAHGLDRGHAAGRLARAAGSDDPLRAGAARPSGAHLDGRADKGGSQDLRF